MNQVMLCSVFSLLSLRVLTWESEGPYFPYRIAGRIVMAILCHSDKLLSSNCFLFIL